MASIKVPKFAKNDLLGKAGRHICAFFRSPEEEDEIMGAYVREGLERGERVVQIVKGSDRQAHLDRMASHGLKPQSIDQRQYQLFDWDQTYLLDGTFSAERMLKLIERTIQAGHEEGYPLVRISGKMEWSLERRGGTEEIYEYESRLNDVYNRYPDPVICCYDLNSYSASFILNILRTHPLVFLNGVVAENPFYTPPPEFLKTFQPEMPLPVR